MRHMGWAALLAAATMAQPAAAATVSDPAGDFLGAYTGPQNGDLDILSAGARIEGANLRVSAVLNGAVGSTAGSIYVFGVNRGGGLPRLTFGSPSVGAGVLFDAVAVLFPDGLGRIAVLPAMGPPAITNLPGAVTVSGSDLSFLFPLALLPSNGLAPEDYSFTMWSRRRVNPLVDGTNAEIADFAGLAFKASVPEPATWAMLILGFGVAGGAIRLRTRAGRAQELRG